MGSLNWSLVFQLGQFLVVSGIGVYLYLEKKNDKTNERMDALESKQELRSDELLERISDVEGQLKQSPTHHDMGELHNKINSVSETSKEMKGQLGSMDMLLRMILNRITERGLS
ncbi:MAG: hypothetical protein JWL63_3220 [Rhodocyclales bacterium]|nr:hypothetical protein [Rhodocyclales bacterium]